jgi:predicted transposase YbfD/YdcC
MPVSHAVSDPSTPADEREDHDISALLQMLGRLTDPRNRRGKRHRLVFILACAVVGVLAGAANFRELGSQVADIPQRLLVKLGAKWNWFKFCYDHPSEPTLRRVLGAIDPGELDLLVGAWLFERAHREDDGTLVIALDGKVLRGAWTDSGDQVTLFSAMIHGKGVTIGQVRVPEGTNEITQVKPLLDGLVCQPGQPVVLTFDAAHTQRETAEYVKGERGFDYMMCVKGNQPSLQQQVLNECLPLLGKQPGHVVEERAHGRINRWTTWTTQATGIDFPHVCQAGCIRRDVFTLTGQAISKEYALIITSADADQIGSADLHTHVRGHWGIENKSHYIRDTTWREDDCHAYTGNGQHTMATLRNLALGLFRINNIHKIKETTEHICRDRSRALPLLAT